MENQTPTVDRNQDTAVQIVGAVFGTAHFVFDSLAQLCVHAEAKIVTQITKGEVSYEERKLFRESTTIVRQQQCIEKVQQLRAQFKSKPSGQPQPAVQ